MKTVFSLLLLHFLSANLIAQEEAAKTHSPELGVNFTFFLDEALDFGGGNTSLNPYFITYKKLDESGIGLRMGAGVSISQQNNKEELGSTTKADVSQTSSSFNFRFGKEWQHKLTNRLMYYYGFDGLVGFGQSHSKSRANDGDVTTKSNSYRGTLGGGPVVGLQFMITDRIGLYTEGALYLANTYRRSKVKFEGTSDEEEKEISNSLGLNLDLPSNIYLFIRF
jgi:hypothetical protein